MLAETRLHDCVAGPFQVHAPAARSATSASFLAKLGGIGEYISSNACSINGMCPGMQSDVLQVSLMIPAKRLVAIVGLVLWCATVLLFLCLLPRSRPRHRPSPYRGRKEVLL